VKTKTDIRAQYLGIRDKIPESYRQTAAVTAASLLGEHFAFKKSELIACYCAHKNEFETLPIIQAIWHAGKKCYLPVLCEGKALGFVRYEDGDELEVNQYGVLEPLNFSRKIPLEQLDLIIMPLVAYDSQGKRLGMGGGYYDRTLAFMHAHRGKPHLAGLAYASQHIDELPFDSWDVKMHSVITELGIRNF
jgi:5-formyltetrahydrofolate cyclo-ligase